MQDLYPPQLPGAHGGAVARVFSEFPLPAGPAQDGRLNGNLPTGSISLPSRSAEKTPPWTPEPVSSPPGAGGAGAADHHHSLGTSENKTRSRDCSSTLTRGLCSAPATLLNPRMSGTAFPALGILSCFTPGPCTCATPGGASFCGLADWGE